MNGYGEQPGGELSDDQVASLRTLLDASDDLRDAADPLVSAHAVAVASATRAVMAHLGAD